MAEFTCALCKGTFDEGQTPEDAEREYRELFPESAAAGEARDVVCDECFKRMTAELPPSDHERERFGDDK